MTTSIINENDKKIICEVAREILKKSKAGWLWPHVLRKQTINVCKDQLSELLKQSNAYVTDCKKILRELSEMFSAEIRIQEVSKKDGTFGYRFRWVGDGGSAMATSIINENDKKIICEAAEAVLKKYPGRMRFFRLWTYMKKEYPELAELSKNNKKVKGFWKEVSAIMLEWQKEHPTKIGYVRIKEAYGYSGWLWYGGGEEIPPPALIVGSAMVASTIDENGKKIICEAAEAVLKKNPGRTRLAILMRYMKIECPELVKFSWKEIRIVIFEWQKNYSAAIGYTRIKEVKGYSNWFWCREGDSTECPEPSSLTLKKDGPETKFYAPFAKWLEQEQSTKAILTDAARGEKWSNPDVVGVKEKQGFGGAKKYEFVSAEIKVSNATGEILAGFGQACAYTLFSHRTYLVVPKDSKSDLLQRIKELCEHHGIGLVVFNRDNPDNPAFELRCSAGLRGNANASYVNNSVKELLKKNNYDIF